MNSANFEAIFGADSYGASPEERALTSNQEFVRSQDHLAIAKPSAKGHRLSAWEALEAFGIQCLLEVVESGSAILPCAPNEPAITLESARLALGFSVEDLARVAHVHKSQILAIENPAIRSPIQLIEKVAAKLGLDERLISVLPNAHGDEALAARLKTLGRAPNMSRSVVSVLSEAAWVIRTQARLHRALNLPCSTKKFSPSSNYGEPGYPVWKHGYYLAKTARDILGISASQPIDSLRKLCEDLKITLLHAELPRNLAGATVNCSGERGIIVNTAGFNSNVWVRRATIAHELGHLFWDPDQRLNRVTVDTYSDIESLLINKQDFVEARANAFAIELLAPMAAAESIYHEAGGGSDGVRSVMDTFGISFSAAKRHIANAVSQEGVMQVRLVDTEPTEDWQAREGYTDDYFPIATTSQIRRGQFSGLVVAAQKRKLLSLETACSYLEADAESYQKSADNIADLFPVGN